MRCGTEEKDRGKKIQTEVRRKLQRNMGKNEKENRGKWSTGALF